MECNKTQPSTLRSPLWWRPMSSLVSPATSSRIQFPITCAHSRVTTTIEIVHFVEFIKFCKHEKNHTQCLPIYHLSKHICLETNASDSMCTLHLFHNKCVLISSWSYPMNTISLVLEELNKLYKMKSSDYCREPKISPRNLELDGTLDGRRLKWTWVPLIGGEWFLKTLSNKE